MNTRLQQCISPIDGMVYAERSLATNEQIEAALAQAVAAQQSWKRVSIAERISICRKMLAWLVERADEIGTELTWQIGRPIAYSPFEIRRGFSRKERAWLDGARGRPMS